MKWRMLLVVGIILITVPSASAPYESFVSEISSNTDINVWEKVRSIEILPADRIHVICKNPVALGCTNLWWDKSGELVYAEIYVQDYVNYTGQENLNNTLYHEIGHVRFAYLYGLNESNNTARVEKYATDYADRFAPLKLLAEPSRF